jgi:hypothetical protein
MVRGNSFSQELDHRFVEHRGISVPRCSGTLDLADADIDLYEEDAYIAGLVEGFLTRASVKVVVIQLDSSIDSRLEKAKAETSAAQVVLRDFKAYRQRVKELAMLLSQASGIPLRSYARD